MNEIPDSPSEINDASPIDEAKYLVLSPETGSYVEKWRRRYAAAGEKTGAEPGDEGGSDSSFGVHGPGLLYLGANTLQIPGILLARKMGIRLHVCDVNSRAPGVNLADEFHQVDLKDIDGLSALAGRLSAAGRVHGVITIGTDFSASVAYVAENNGLPGISYKSALDASRKHRMRKIFREAGLPSPASAALDADTITSVEKLRAAVKELSYPLIAKPSDNMGARGVAEISSEDELQETCLAALEHSRNGVVIVEEKITGPEYSLDSLISCGKLFPMGIARRHIDYSPYFIERGHSFPSDLSVEAEKQMFAVLEKAAAVLGIRNGAAKGDIFYTASGPVIGEVAARLSGGFMSGWTFPLHSGVQPAVGAIQIALGQNLIQDFAPEYFSGGSGGEVTERGLLSIPGIVERVAAPTLSAESWFFPSVERGSRVRFPRNNVEKCGNLICRSGARDTEALLSSFVVVLQPRSTVELQQALGGDYPPAYPGLLKIVENSLGAKVFGPGADVPSPPAGHPYQLPEACIESPEEDWNFRTVLKSLKLLSRLHPGFRWVTAADSVIDSSSRFFCGALLKGGVQAALYYLELTGKSSEH